jgi:hypothetical protein
MQGAYQEMSLILGEIVEHQETRTHQPTPWEAANHSVYHDHAELVIIANDYTIRMNKIASLLSNEHLQEVIFHWKDILGGMQKELDSRDKGSSGRQNQH